MRPFSLLFLFVYEKLAIWLLSMAHHKFMMKWFRKMAQMVRDHSLYCKRDPSYNRNDVDNDDDDDNSFD